MARLLGAADRWRRSAAVPRQVRADERACRMAQATALAALGEPSFAAAWSAGEDMTLEEAIAEAERYATLHGAPSAQPAVAMEGAGVSPAEAPPITPREVEVLRLLEAGLSDKAIADRLYISVRTAENHVRRINRKLDTTSRTEAVAAARAAGLLPVETPALPATTLEHHRSGRGSHPDSSVPAQEHP